MPTPWMVRLGLGSHPEAKEGPVSEATVASGEGFSPLPRAIRVNWLSFSRCATRQAPSAHPLRPRAWPRRRRCRRSLNRDPLSVLGF